MALDDEQFDERIGVERVPEGRGLTIAETHAAFQEQVGHCREFFLSLLKGGSLDEFFEEVQAGVVNDVTEAALDPVARTLIERLLPAADCRRNQAPPPPQREEPVFGPALKLYRSDTEAVQSDSESEVFDIDPAFLEVTPFAPRISRGRTHRSKVRIRRTQQSRSG